MSGENIRAETRQKPDSRLRAAAALLALCAVLVLFLALVQALIGDRVRAGSGGTNSSGPSCPGRRPSRRSGSTTSGPT